MERNFERADILPNTDFVDAPVVYKVGSGWCRKDDNKLCIPINDATAKNLMKQHENQGYILLSTCRSENTAQQNNIATHELKNSIIESMFSYKEVFCAYRAGNDEVSFEKSFMIFPAKYERDSIKVNVEFDDLYDFAMRESIQYQQNTILAKFSDGKT